MVDLLLYPNILTYDVSNLTIVLLGIALILWIVRLCRISYSLSELQIAINSNQIIRTDNNELADEDEGIINRTILDQIMRTRNTVPTKELKYFTSQINIDKSTIQLVKLESDQSNKIGIKFSMECLVPCSIQIIWGVSASEVEKALCPQLDIKQDIEKNYLNIKKIRKKRKKNVKN